MRSFVTRSSNILLSSYDVLPTARDVDTLREVCGAGLHRGYFTPDEETKIRAVFIIFLQARSALISVITEARARLPLFRRNLQPADLNIFVPGWLAGCMLMRSSRYLVEEFGDCPPIRKLLNQADPVNSLPPNMFNQVEASVTRLRNLTRFFWALQIAERHETDIAELATAPGLAPLLEKLEAEKPFLASQKRVHAKTFAACRIGRARQRPRQAIRQIRWTLFELSGRLIAQGRNPLHRKRVRPGLLRRLARELQPGDVLITRHDDALSNWFLPGFWPHAALCLGTEAQRRALGITGRVANLRGMHFLEARKDGVQVRPLTDTLAVDAFLVLRPVILSREERATVLENALRHEGKLYDFEFDFTRSDRLVCTEVIYRSLNGVGPVAFSLERKAGRFTLPAESLLQQALLPENGFELIMLYGLQGNQILYGHPAVQLLQRSLSNPGNP